jgi:hypothetical protein
MSKAIALSVKVLPLKTAVPPLIAKAASELLLKVLLVTVDIWIDLILEVRVY